LGSRLLCHHPTPSTISPCEWFGGPKYNSTLYRSSKWLILKPTVGVMQRKNNFTDALWECRSDSWPMSACRTTRCPSRYFLLHRLKIKATAANPRIPTVCQRRSPSLENPKFWLTDIFLSVPPSRLQVSVFRGPAVTQPAVDWLGLACRSRLGKWEFPVELLGTQALREGDNLGTVSDRKMD